MQTGLHVKYLNLFDRLSEKNPQYQIRPLGDELLQADRHDEANSRFPQIANAPKKCHEN